jgi:UDP-N-acetylmuramoyl-tripeptide--D-alanyl-D-alanine ligase
VLGDMAELGPEAPRWHAEVGRACVALGIDVVVGVGELAAAYATAAEGCEWHYAVDVETAAGFLPEILRPGDVVLLKGSRSARIERLAELGL